MTAPHAISWWTRRTDELYQYHFPSDYPTASALAPLLSHSAFDHLILSLNTACTWDPLYLQFVALPNRVTVCCVLVWSAILLTFTLSTDPAVSTSTCCMASSW